MCKYKNIVDTKDYLTTDATESKYLFFLSITVITKSEKKNMYKLKIKTTNRMF